MGKHFLHEFEDLKIFTLMTATVFLVEIFSLSHKYFTCSPVVFIQ